MHNLVCMSSAFLFLAAATGCASQNSAGLETGDRKTAEDRTRHERASRNVIDAMTLQQYTINGLVF